MTRLTICLAAGAATLAVAVPAAAQTTYPYAYPQQTYQQGQYGYPQSQYGYPQSQYGYPQQGQNVIGQMIGQLLGTGYNTNDRNAVERCATAAVTQANAQYRPNQYRQGYGYQYQGYGYPNQANNPATMMRVTAITDVQRRQSGLRISGLLDSQGGYQAYGYQNQRYAAQGDLTFRCNVDYRGAVTNLRVRPNKTAYNR